MRIAILSLPLHTNYGGILQAYALQTTLERMGHHVQVIDRPWIPRPSIKHLCRVLPLRFIRKYIKGENITLMPEQYYAARRYEERAIHTRQFIKQNIHIKSVATLRKLNRFDYDAIIVGSDQVWRPKYFAGWGDIRDAFLYFAKQWDIKRISYAASFATDHWEYTPQQTDEARCLLQLFDGVSVREAKGVEFCQDHLASAALHVLDPTLILAKDDYDKLIQQSPSAQSTGRLLNYILDDTPDKHHLINRVAEEKGLTPYRINESEELNAQVIRKPVSTWLQAFRDAEFIVTDSFHACVFSVIFHKPFICLGNKERGISRFQVFTDNLSLSSNIINDIQDYNPSIDYTPKQETYTKLARMRELSINFLTTHLCIPPNSQL